MNDKILNILSKADDWMTAAKIAEKGNWRSASNVSVALKQLEDSGHVTHRDNMTEYGKEIHWRITNKNSDIACKAEVAVAPEINADELRTKIQRQKDIAQELTSAKAKVVPKRKTSKPRKRFNVTGLAGFYVDGDRVTLFLDRRIDAKSITLPAEKLRQLAEIVKTVSSNKSFCISV